MNNVFSSLVVDIDANITCPICSIHSLYNGDILDMGIDDKELKLMNSPIKYLLQKFLEFRIFKTFLASLNFNLTGKILMEVGCGSGYGLELITRTFKPIEFVAFDILPEEVHLAKQRNLPVDLFIGDVLDIKQHR